MLCLVKYNHELDNNLQINDNSLRRLRYTAAKDDRTKYDLNDQEWKTKQETQYQSFKDHMKHVKCSMSSNISYAIQNFDKVLVSSLLFTWS